MAAPLSFARFRQTLLRGAAEPVYVFEGEEAFFHDEGVRLLEETLLTPASRDMNRESLRGDQTTLDRLVDLAATYPMGPGRRLVVVRDADAIGGEGSEALVAYLASPNPRTCLVLSDASFDRRRVVAKALARGATWVACAPIEGEAALLAWVRERLQARGYGIGPELAEAIGVSMAGAGLARLEAELLKLMSAIGAPRPVEAADLAILSGAPRVGDAFQAARAALSGDRGAAIGAVRGLLDGGEEPPMILGAFAWYVRSALKARASGERRVAPRDLWALYALNASRADQFRAETAGIPVSALRSALRLCARADHELKGGGARARVNALERLVHGLARAAARPA